MSPIIINSFTRIECDSETKLVIPDKFNELIQPGCIPETVTEIVFNNLFNQPIDVGVLPKGLTHLTFGYSFDRSIEVGVLPNSLTHLTFGGGFNRSIDVGVLPNSLTHLTFCGGFNKHIDIGVLPNSLTHLTFGWKFNQSIESGVLPNSLTHLTFGESYDKHIDVGVLPNSLIHLNIGRDFNKPIEVGILPNSLKSLYINVNYIRYLKKNFLPIPTGIFELFVYVYCTENIKFFLNNIIDNNISIGKSHIEKLSNGWIITVAKLTSINNANCNINPCLITEYINLCKKVKFDPSLLVKKIIDDIESKYETNQKIVGNIQVPYATKNQLEIIIKQLHSNGHIKFNIEEIDGILTLKYSE